MNSRSDDDLMVRYIEGAASAEEVTLLETRLRTDPGARREFVRLAHVQALFVDLPRASVVIDATSPPFRRWHVARAAGLVAAALVLVAIALVARPARSGVATVTALQGAVRCLREQDVVPLRVGDAVQPGDQFALAGFSTLSVSWAGEVSVDVEQYSILTVGGEGASTIYLSSGAVHAVVISHSGNAFAIATADGVARDLGTDFIVHCDAGGTAVQVAAGLVMLENALGRVTVPAGRSASLHAGRAPALEIVPPHGQSAGQRQPAPATIPAPAVRPPPPPPPLVDVTSPSSTGTVTHLDGQRRAFTLRDDRSGETSEYRAHFAGGHAEAIVARIASLQVGEHLTVGYIEQEGRRALSIVTTPPP